MTDSGIIPENLPRAEDVKKIGRRHLSEEKKLPKRTEALKTLGDDFDGLSGLQISSELGHYRILVRVALWGLVCYYPRLGYTRSAAMARNTNE